MPKRHMENDDIDFMYFDRPMFRRGEDHLIKRGVLAYLSETFVGSIGIAMDGVHGVIRGSFSINMFGVSCDVFVHSQRRRSTITFYSGPLCYAFG